MKHLALMLIVILSACSDASNEVDAFPKANVSYSDYETLVTEVKKHRAARLVSLQQFLEKSQDENTIILDTRSKDMFTRKHIKGAIHLNFSDFTQSNLKRVIPDLNTTILIYCNNNFRDDDINFASKVVLPVNKDSNEKEVSLALNIPTYINLYGYGYKNIYELAHLISTRNKHIEFEGTSVIKN